MKSATGATFDRLQDQLISNPASSTPPSEENSIVIEPPVEAIVVGTLLLQYVPIKVAPVVAPS